VLLGFQPNNIMFLLGPYRWARICSFKWKLWCFISDSESGKPL